jgi:glycosyltransferase involved in cell wall biosynthesis
METGAHGSRESLRLLMVAPTAAPGGQEDILFNLATCMPALNVSPRVISLHDGALVERLRTADIEVEVVEAGRLRQSVQFVRTARVLRAKMRQGRFDVVYSNMPKAHLYVAWGARRERIPTLWCQAGYPDPPHWLDRLATTLPANAIIAESRDAVAAQERLGPHRKVHLMHPGIDIQRFKPRADTNLRQRHGIPLDAPLVSIVGRLQPWKGQRQFLAAAAAVARSHPTAYFAVVGGAILGWEGDYPQELERLASTLGLQERTVFTGHTSETAGWMAASDVVVNASDPEPFGLVVVEAMASGCAVVAVSKGGPRDAIEHGTSGLLCPSREPGVLAGAIMSLVDNADLRARLGRAARVRVQAHFTREAMTRRFGDILRTTVRMS